MPFGVLTKEQFAQELCKVSPSFASVINSPVISPVLTGEIIKGEVVSIVRGRGPVKEVPESLRTLIGTEAVLNGQHNKIAEAFGVSPSSVSAYKNGATSTASYNLPESNLKEAIDSAKQVIATSAREKIKLALDKLTEESLVGAKIKDIASIAKDMSVVMKNMEDGHGGIEINNKVLVYQPKLREDDEYEVINSPDL